MANAESYASLEAIRAIMDRFEQKKIDWPSAESETILLMSSYLIKKINEAAQKLIQDGNMAASEHLQLIDEYSLSSEDDTRDTSQHIKVFFAAESTKSASTDTAVGFSATAAPHDDA